MSTNRALITGMALVASPGWGGGDFIAQLGAQDPLLKAWPKEVTPPWDGAKLAMAEGFPASRYFTDRQLRLIDRAMVMGTCAVGLALDDAGLTDEASLDRSEVATIFGTTRCEQPSSHRFSQPLLMGKPRSMNPAQFPLIARNVAAGQIAITFGLRGMSSMLASGPLASLQAIARGADLVRSGKVDVALVGGIESLAPFSINHSRHLYGERLMGTQPSFFGFEQGQVTLGDGSSMIVIESEAHAKARGARAYCEILGSVGGTLGTDRSAEAAEKRLTGLIAGREHQTENWRRIGVISCGLSGSASQADSLERDMLSAIFARHDVQPLLTAVRSHIGEAESAAAAAQVQVAASALFTRQVMPTRYVASDPAVGLNPAKVSTPLASGEALVTAFDASLRFVHLHLGASPV